MAESIIMEDVMFLGGDYVLETYEEDDGFSIVCPVISKEDANCCGCFDLKGYFVGLKGDGSVLKPIREVDNKFYYSFQYCSDFLYVVTRIDKEEIVRGKEEIAYVFVYNKNDDLLFEQDLSALLIDITFEYSIFDLAKLAEKAIPVLKSMGYSGD